MGIEDDYLEALNEIAAQSVNVNKHLQVIAQNIEAITKKLDELSR